MLSVKDLRAELRPKRLMPRIDRLPVFSSPWAGVLDIPNPSPEALDLRDAGDRGVAVGPCEAEGLRLQKGIPEGVCRDDDSFLPEESKLERDLPGLVGRP